MSDSDFSGIDAMIAELHRLPSATAKILPEVGEAIIAEATKNISAQRGPDGTPWTPGRSGQAKVLANAAKALSGKVSGKTLVVILSGVEARHHLGAIKGAGSIALGAGGKRRDKGHRKGERAKMAAKEGGVVGARMSAYARPILPDEQNRTVLQRALDSAMAEGLDPAIWRGHR